MKNVVVFKIRGKFAHFLRAEAGVSALTYPVPPKTVLLGLIGAVLGLAKDRPQLELGLADIAVAGLIPLTHWHKVKLRKDPPEALPRVIKNSQKTNKDTKEEKASLIAQEWLFQPEYTVWASLPESYHSCLEERLREHRWHYQPYLGLTEMPAEVEYLAGGVAIPMPPGCYEVESLVNQSQAELNVSRVHAQGLALHIVRMPRTVTTDRVFTHATYLVEKDARPIPVNTGVAYQVGERTLMFL